MRERNKEKRTLLKILAIKLKLQAKGYGILGNFQGKIISLLLRISLKPRKFQVHKYFSVIASANYNNYFARNYSS